MSTAEALINKLNAEYSRVHHDFEECFWAVKMGLHTADNSSEKLNSTKIALNSFLSSKDNLNTVRQALAQENVPPHQRAVLEMMEKTFKCYLIENPEAEAIQKQLIELETELEAKRGAMRLGYIPAGQSEDAFIAASAPELSLKVRTAPDEQTRHAAYDALRSIGPFVVEDYIRIVKLRNQFARALGYDDFYEMKVRTAEGFSKATLFGILDKLVDDTNEIYERTLAWIAEKYGPDALKGWNCQFHLSSGLTREMDPFFPFEEAPLRWGECMSRLGVHYRESTLSLDLCDRQGKYSNGFCHWPIPPFMDPATGRWIASRSNFTSLAVPNSAGSGQEAMRTLMHEGGHAAHMANITQVGRTVCGMGCIPRSVGLWMGDMAHPDNAASHRTYCTSPHVIIAIIRDQQIQVKSRHHAQTAPSQTPDPRPQTPDPNMNAPASPTYPQQDSPFFAQERAPMSVPYAETQSMFIESLMGDAAWLARYARDRQGRVIPWELIERNIRQKHPIRSMWIRTALCVPYFEKAIYEASPDQLTPEFVLNLSDSVEQRLARQLATRPLMAVPHILSDESSCYYHAYILAELAVSQTRRHFQLTYGRITDDPRVGEDLAHTYWRPGSGVPYFDLVARLTKAPFSSGAFVGELVKPLEEHLAGEKRDYDLALANPAPALGLPLSLLLRAVIRFVHGDEVVSECGPTAPAKSFEEACALYKQWVLEKWPRKQ
ncbi:putative oligoendopeptidase f [Paratrimastix pyriformis]|uniref:Oligoendopeptidase f n=1 Tax=Paratrimastix pyriformis TaxID=342808 RepID=A0ABQ8UMJ6_9EUKA|nr:putative oligoendopeptidase f [Paratrimastix pyriformis]